MAGLYNNFTVKDLKDLIKERKVLHCGGNRKADYIQSLVDDDEFKAAQDDFAKETMEFTNHIQQQSTKLREMRTTIKEKMDVIRELCEQLDIKLSKFEEKEQTSEGLTIEEYKEYTNLLRKRVQSKKDVFTA
jgi:hypothetical protein